MITETFLLCCALASEPIEITTKAYLKRGLVIQAETPTLILNTEFVPNFRAIERRQEWRGVVWIRFGLKF